MAKKNTTKKSAAKNSGKTVKKSAPKTKVVKKTTATKTAAKVSSGKKAAPKKKSTAVAKPAKTKTTSSKTKDTKKIIKPKTIVKKTGQKSPMAKKAKKLEDTHNERVAGVSAAEARAQALQKIKGYSKKDLDHFKEIILEKRDEIIEQLQNLRDQMLDPTTGEYINENSPYSLHMAEQGTDAMEREKTFLYAQRENKFLGYLEDALKRIESGTYGICIECIDEPQNLCETCPLIPKARLAAVPHSQLCLPIKQRQEKR
jgi:DnaK suppressor protein